MLFIYLTPGLNNGADCGRFSDGNLRQAGSVLECRISHPFTEESTDYNANVSEVLVVAGCLSFDTVYVCMLHTFLVILKGIFVSFFVISYFN